MDKILGTTPMSIHPYLGLALLKMRQDMQPQRIVFDVNMDWLGEAFRLEHQALRFGLTQNLNREDTHALMHDIHSIAIATNQTQSDLLASLKVLSQKNIPLEQNLEALTAIGRTATATGISLVDLSRLGGTAMNKLKIKPTELEAFFDYLIGSGQKNTIDFNINTGSKSRQRSFVSSDVLNSHVMDQYTGTIDADFNAIMHTTIEQSKRLAITLQQLGATFSYGFSSALMPVIDTLNTVLHQGTQMINDHPKIGHILGSLTLGFSAFTSILTTVTAAQWLWNSALMANPVGLLIAGLGTAATLIVANFDIIKKALGDSWQAVKAFFGLQQQETSTSDTQTLTQKIHTAHEIVHVKQQTAPVTISAPITVQAAPGMNETQVAEYIQRKLQEREAQARAKQRGILFDYSEYAIP